MDLHDQVRNYIEKHDLIEAGGLIVAGVSGGPDSLTLLDTLFHLGFYIVVAHLDHQFRPESSREAEFVSNVARNYGLEFVLETLPVNSLNQSGVSLEEVARIARYQFLWRTAQTYRAHYVAVGHTSDDQAETILMHIIRGAGLHGMRGMLPARSMKQWAPEDIREQDQHPVLVRPLLEISREQTVRHCIDIDVSPTQDKSNYDLSFFRNRIRHELLPLLETYNNSIRRHLQQTGQIMIEHSSCLDGEILKTLFYFCRHAGHRSWAVNRDRFLKADAALQRGILRHLITILLPDETDISYSVIDRARTSILAGVPKRLSILGDIHVLQAGEEAVLCDIDDSPEFPQFPQLQSDVLLTELGQSAGEITLNSGWRIVYRFMDVVDIELSNIYTEGCHSDFEKFILDERQRLLLRMWSAGDRIVIDKEMHTKKLSDVFIDQHIPEAARHRWPVLINDGTVLWIPGVRRSVDIKMGSSRSRGFSVRLDHALSELDFSSTERLTSPDDNPVVSTGIHLRLDKDSVRVMKSLVGTGSIFDTAMDLRIAPDLIVKPALRWSAENGIDLLHKSMHEKDKTSFYLTAEGLQVLRSYLRYVCKEVN